VSRPFKIVRNAGSCAHCGHSWREWAIESHDTEAAARHALDVLNAHEARNGRGENYYRLEMPVLDIY